MLCNQISFQAKFINNTHILKRTPENIFKPLTTSFIEIEPTNENDIKALDTIGRYWENSYAMNISHIAKSMYKGDFSANDTKIYGLTKQSEHFNHLEANDLLGLVEITPTGKNKIHINHLQVDPQEVYTIAPDYNKIGSRILDSLKKIYNTITLKPVSKGVAKFYEINGFIPTKENPKVYIWTV